METLKVGDKVNIKKDFVAITEKLDLGRLDGDIVGIPHGVVYSVAFPYGVNTNLSYVVECVDCDGDIGIKLDKEDEFLSYFYTEALEKIEIKNEKD